MNPYASRALLTLLLIAAAACAPLQRASTALAPARTAEIAAAIEETIAARKMPGAAVWVERRGAPAYHAAFGMLYYEAGAPATKEDTVFDAASLTKVVATAPSVLLLAEDGKLDLDAPLVRYFPECANGGKEAITLRHLLTHSSGLPGGLPAKPAWRGKEAARALACKQVVTHPPGTFFRYSDINYILLGLLVEHASGMPLNEFAQRRIYAPLGMLDTGYLPQQKHALARIAPTQKSPAVEGKALHDDLADGQMLRGVVHDPTARFMGGVGGSAGLFTTVADLARYARMLLAGGTVDGVRVMSADSVRLLTTAQSPPGLALRAMGMDIDSPYARPRGSIFPVGSYGHTG
ncbi:MAG TPA: serine hydrolase domain-containing protein, partial [Burkholderiaceae bacterium]